MEELPRRGAEGEGSGAALRPKAAGSSVDRRWNSPPPPPPAPAPPQPATRKGVVVIAKAPGAAANCQEGSGVVAGLAAAPVLR